MRNSGTFSQPATPFSAGAERKDYIGSWEQGGSASPKQMPSPIPLTSSPVAIPRSIPTQKQTDE